MYLTETVYSKTDLTGVAICGDEIALDQDVHVAVLRKVLASKEQRTFGNFYLDRVISMRNIVLGLGVVARYLPSGKLYYSSTEEGLKTLNLVISLV